MKRIVGYLINRTDGTGITGKTVAFQNLAGAAITSAMTGGYLSASSSTSATAGQEGRFHAYMELSPGPVNVLVTVSGSEVKRRLWDEQAKLGYTYSSDIERLARVSYGVVDGFLNELDVSIPAGHTVRVGTGLAIFNGGVFSIENGYIEVAGTANNNAAIATRLDLVTLRQWNETTTTAQNSGKQEIIITEGTSSGVVPAVPTHAEYTDFPLRVISTAHLASTKTLSTDRRIFTNAVSQHQHAMTFGTDFTNVVIAPASTGIAIAECPAGQRVTGGGFFAPTANVLAMESYPATDTTWRCKFDNSSGTSKTGTCYAMCIDDITVVN